MIDELKAKLQAEVERLNHEINFVLPKEIEKARAHGDLRENSEYKAALERQNLPRPGCRISGSGCRSCPGYPSRTFRRTGWGSALA